MASSSACTRWNHYGVTDNSQYGAHRARVGCARSQAGSLRYMVMNERCAGRTAM